MNLIISLLLTISLVFSGLTSLLQSGRDEAVSAMAEAEETTETETSAETEAETATNPDTTLTRQTAPDTAYADMDYTHYDPTAFYTDVQQLSELADGEDSEAVIELYDELYDEYAVISTLDTLSYIHYCDDVTDDYWSEENLYCDDLLAQAGDALCIACRRVLEGPCAQAFADHIGQDAADAFLAYEAMTEEKLALSNEISELVSEYYEIIDASDQTVYNYLGENWTMDMLSGFQGTALAERDYDGYLEVYYGIQKSINDQVGPIYLQLVQLRTEAAELAGYDSYNEYAYELVYGRDYTPEQAQALCDAVKPLAAEFYGDLYYSDLWTAYDDVSPVLDAQGLVDALGQYVVQIDDTFALPFDSFSSLGLYDLGDSDSRVSGAYTIDLHAYNSPFIFATLYGDCYDLSTLTHEFGHFTDAYYNAMPNLLTSVGSYDLFEIHSNGLEVLFTRFYDELYTSGADTALFLTLGEQLNSVIEGCIYDEFQRRLYAQPDMTLDEVNRLYCSVCAEYGQYEPGDEDYYWMFVSHNFESPLYYISYAASSLAALQIWDLAQEDYDAATDAYLSILSRGAYGDGYLQVLTDCGLRVFTGDGAVEDICRPVLDYLAELAWDSEY